MSAQDSTQQKVLLVPFELKLYQSTIDNEVAQKEGISSLEVKTGFRNGVNSSLTLMFKGRCSVHSFLVSDSANNSDLARIYQSIGYSYEPIHTEKDTEEDQSLNGKIQARLGKLQSKLNREEKKEEGNQNGVQNGQVVTHIDNTPKFMQTVLLDESILGYLKDKYQADMIVFINQMDIFKSIDENGKEGQTKIQLHYTCMDMNANIVSSGLAISYFESYIRDLKEICGEHLYDATNYIANSIK
jgi:hypothetical protein